MLCHHHFFKVEDHNCLKPHPGAPTPVLQDCEEYQADHNYIMTLESLDHELG
jgi:hypothetical protein